MSITVRTYEITITHKMPLLMHADNIQWADDMDKWRLLPAHKKVSKAGDDRSPAHRWIGSLYNDNHVVGIPTDNLMRCFMEGGAMVPVPGGKNGKTFKAQTQSGMVVQGGFSPLLVGPSRAVVPMSAITPLLHETSFEEHCQQVERLGFGLHVKRAKIGTSKHIRVRPEFKHWSSVVHLQVWDDQITQEAVEQIVTQAGAYKGLGDWRPGGKTPGPFGTFSATVKEA